MTQNALPVLLVVDDDFVIREAISESLGERFEVVTVDSGEAALAWLETAGNAPPDLLLLDIEMHQLDGYETCTRLRAAGHTMPVIFVSSHDTLEERLRAFDAGGDDFLSKPFDGLELLRKSERGITRHAETRGLQAVTSQILHEVGETGVMLGFLREAIRITDYAALAGLLLRSVGDYGVRCNVQLRHNDGSFTLTPDGAPTDLELSIFERAVSLGRQFRFSRRLVINYHYISLLVLDVPVDEERARRLVDYFEVLVESAEAVAETISMRRESAVRAETLMVASSESYSAIESLRESYHQQQSDTRLLLQKLIDEVETTYVHLGLTENQEETVSFSLRHSAENILRLFEQSVEFDRRFAIVLDAMRPQQNTDADVWL